MSLRTAAGLPDLSMSIITSPTSQPFPNAIPVKFQSKVLNIGNGPATNLIFTLYVDGNIENSIEAEGTLNAGEEAVLSFFMECNVGGSHGLKIVVNESKTITESNYSNNSAEGYFKWADCIALSADALYTSDGETEFESNQSKKIIFKFSNSGTLSASNVLYVIEANGSAIAQGNVNVPAHKVLTGSINVTIHKAGNYEFALKIDPNNTINDLNPYNNSKYLTLVVSYDTELFVGKWEDASDFDVEVHSSAIEMMTNNTQIISTEQTSSAIRYWNGINSSVHFNTIRYDSISDPDTVDQTAMPIHIYAKESIPGGYIGKTTLFKAGNGGAIHIPEDDVMTDDSNYVRGEILLSESELESLTSAQQKKTVAHEIGHVLGLAHPQCGDVALMRQTADTLVAYTIQPHDRYNLNKQY